MQPVVLSARESVDVLIDVDISRVTHGLHGRVSAITDDPMQRMVSLDFEGTVGSDFFLEPPVIALGTLTRNAALDREFRCRVARNDGAPFRIVDLTRCPAGVFAVPNAAVDDRTSWDISVRVYGLPIEGPFRDEIEFACDDGTKGTVGLTGEVPYSIRAVPSRFLRMDPLPRNGISHGQILVRSEREQTFAGMSAQWRWGTGCEWRPSLVPRIIVQGPREALILIDVSDNGELTRGCLISGFVDIRNSEPAFETTIEVVTYLAK